MPSRCPSWPSRLARGHVLVSDCAVPASRVEGLIGAVGDVFTNKIQVASLLRSNFGSCLSFWS